MNVATAPRERFKINIRKKIDFFYRSVRKILRVITKNKEKVLRQVMYYPVVTDEKVLADLINRVAWYLPDSAFSQVDIVIPVGDRVAKNDIMSLRTPVYQQRYIKQSTNIKLVSKKNLDLGQADAILVWDKSKLLNIRVLPHIARTEVVDPTYYSTIESGTYMSLYYRTLEHKEKELVVELSKKNYQSLLNKVMGYDKAYVFGTGPSLDRAMEFDYSDGFCVVCNSIVKNKTLLQHIKPQLLVFADPVFHFSPCLYSAEFRRLMLDVVKEFDCYIMLPEHNVPLYLSHCPELENKIIGMPVYGENYNFPNYNNFNVRGSANILTLFMLPVASAVAREIYIIGADGRNPDEKYFWKHSSSSQFDDLMQTVFNTHPSFFRDRVYTDYYKQHCDFLEGLIHYGERLGKKYYTLTPSYIPALECRLAKGEKNEKLEN